MNYILLLILIFLPSSAYAYIDPGTGSLILQALVAGFLAAIFTIKLWWQKFISFFKGKDKEDE